MPADYMTTESRLPFSLEAEQSVLGAALLDAGSGTAGAPGVFLPGAAPQDL